MKKWKIIGTIAVIILLIVIFKFQKGEEAVDGVRDTCFESYDGATLGELFEQYFKDSEWEYDKEHGQVVFTGICDAYGEEQKIKICFDVDREDHGNEYTISSNVDTCELGGEELDEDVWLQIMQDVIDNYSED